MKENGSHENIETVDKDVYDIDNKNSHNSKRFWKYFWGTIIIFAIIFIILNITPSKKLSEISNVDRKAKLEIIIRNFKAEYPQYTNMVTKFNTQSIKEIKKSINKNIDNAYEPLYSQIGNLSNFHYSVSGEYTELFTAIFGNVKTILEDKLFKPANYNKRLSNALDDINSDSIEIITKQFQRMKSDMQNKLNISSDDIDFLFAKILRFTQNDMQNRFKNGVSIGFRGVGIGVGVAGAAMIEKIISKKMASVIAKKILTKAAIKGGSKLAGSAAGATAGAESGLLCGPGAWLCSPAGAVAGGIVGWFATDKIVVEVDQYFNEENFKKEIRAMINQQKQSTKNTLYKIYTESIDKIKNTNMQSLESIKSKNINEIIQDK